MHTSIWHVHAATSLIGCTALVLTVTVTVTGVAHAQPQRDLGRQVLGAGDGWGSAEGGTAGGSAADASHVRTVTTWAGFKAALKDGGDAVEPHTSMSSGFPWQDQRFAEYRNTGPGAVTSVPANRPQLTAEQARSATRAACLGDGEPWDEEG